MSKTVPHITTPQDALLFCDYFARFCAGETAEAMGGVSRVIRDLMIRLEKQAMRTERAEAMKGGAE